MFRFSCARARIIIKNQPSTSSATLHFFKKALSIVTPPPSSPILSAAPTANDHENSESCAQVSAAAAAAGGYCWTANQPFVASSTCLALQLPHQAPISEESSLPWPWSDREPDGRPSLFVAASLTIPTSLSSPPPSAPFWASAISDGSTIRRRKRPVLACYSTSSCGLVGAELLGARRRCSTSTTTTPAPAQTAASCTPAVPPVPPPPPPVPVRDFTSINADKEQLEKFVLAISNIVPPPSLGDSDEWVKFVTSVGTALKKCTWESEDERIKCYIAEVQSNEDVFAAAVLDFFDNPPQSKSLRTPSCAFCRSFRRQDSYHPRKHAKISGPTPLLAL